MVFDYDYPTRDMMDAQPASSTIAGPPRRDAAIGAYSSADGSAQNVELNLATLWRVVNEWRWLILGSLVAGLAAAVIITLLTTPIYKSTATLEVNPPSVEVIEDESAAPALQNDTAYLATQFGLLESRSLAERVAQDLNLASNEAFVDQEANRNERQEAAVEKLMNNFEVEEMDESRLIRIAYFDEDPVLSTRIVNGFGEAFISTSLERRYQASAYARDFLENQIGRIRSDLEQSEQRLIGYAQAQGIMSAETEDQIADSASLQRTALESLNKELAAVQAKRIEAEERYRQALRTPLSREQQEGTAELRNQRALLSAEYQEKLRVFKPDYPEMIELEARIDALDQAIASSSSTVRQARSGTLEEDYRAALGTENELRQRVNALKAEVLDLRGSSVQYSILQREVDTNRSLYDALLQRYKEVGVAGGVGNSQVSIVDPGTVPNNPARPNLWLNLVLGTFGGLLVGLGIALALEFISDVVKSPEDVRKRLGLSFLGGIPQSKSERPVEDLSEQGSPLAEAYFSAATSLQFASETGIPRTLLLASSRPAEGKSTTAWALATQFASLGKSVLLIDSDMRKPTFVTGHEKEDGLSTLLTSRERLREHVVPTDTPRLTILPCGPTPPNPAELLSSGRFEELLEEAKAHYDCVVIDGPPVLGLADSPILARICDATLIVIESGKTRVTAAIEAINRIRQADSNIIGAILTRYRHESAGYGYNYDAYTYKSSENRMRQIRVLGGGA